MDFSIFLGPWDRYRAEEVLKSTRLPAPCYHCDEGVAIIRLAKKVFWVSFSILCFPVGIYQLLHQVARSVLMSASLKDRTDVIRFAQHWPLDTFTMSQFLFSLVALKTLGLFCPQTWLAQKLVGRDRSMDGYFEPSRFVVSTDHAYVDALFLRQKGIESLKRIVLYSCSEAELAEGNIYNVELLTLARKINAHVILWNHPGIGASVGASSRSNMTGTYCKMLELVEKKMGAKEIVTYGHSLGAAVAMEGLTRYHFQPTTKHLMIARSTVSTSSNAMGAAYGKLASLFVWAAGWNFNNLRAIAKIPGRCIVVQTAAVADCELLQRSEQVVPDGVWDEPEATLGHALLRSGTARQQENNWKVVGVKENYGMTLGSKGIALLSDEINTYFPRPWWRSFF